MQKRSRRKKKPDLNELAAQISMKATEEGDSSLEDNKKKKNPHAVALGRLGGLKGGPARAKKLSEKQRMEIARKAAETRWRKKGKRSD
jgi:hypothetical protein